MKIIGILLIDIYRMAFSPLLHLITATPSACRYSPTCSVYAKQSLQANGFMKGIYLSFVRFISCQPFITIKI